MDQSNAIEAFIRAECERLGPGARLAGNRNLQDRFHASPVTIQRTLRRLTAEGLVVTRPGDGSYVAAPQASTQRLSLDSADFSWQSSVLGRAPFAAEGLDHLTVELASGVIALDGGFPDQSLQAHALLQRAAARAGRTSSAWNRALPEGMLSLRTKFAMELGDGFGAEDVIITPGIQSAIDSIFRSFTRPGESILIEDPSYPGAIAAGTFAGLTLVPVPTDQHGMRTDLVEAAIERSGARLAFVQPRYSNPSGSVMATERRRELLDIAVRRNLFVLEDDWVRDLHLGQQTPEPLHAPSPLVQDDPHGHVIYLRSLSKTTAPGMRVGAVIARGPAAERLRSVRLVTDFFTAPLLQATMVELFEDRAWVRHLQHMRAELRARRDALTNVLSEKAPQLSFDIPQGGVSLWVRLPKSVPEPAFVAECRARGVRVGAGRHYWVSEPPSGYVRISFAGADVAGLEDAAHRIARAAVLAKP